MMNMMQMLRCKLTAKRLSRYVDMDPAALLVEAEIQKVRRHLAECRKCTKTVSDLTKIKDKLRWIGSAHLPDEGSLNRLQAKIDSMTKSKE